MAIAAAAFFAVRDNVIRWAAGETDLDAIAAATFVLLAGGLAYAGYLLIRRRGELGPALGRPSHGLRPPGSCLASRTERCPWLLRQVRAPNLPEQPPEAFARGQVTVVAPLIATELLWAVFLAAVLLGASELIGRRIVFAALLVVGGSILIGAFAQ